MLSVTRAAKTIFIFLPTDGDTLKTYVLTLRRCAFRRIIHLNVLFQRNSKQIEVAVPIKQIMLA